MYNPFPPPPFSSSATTPFQPLPPTLRNQHRPIYYNTLYKLNIYNARTTHKKSWTESHKRDKATKFSPHNCTILLHSARILNQSMFKYTYLSTECIFGNRHGVRNKYLLIRYIFYKCNNTQIFNKIHRIKGKVKPRIYFAERQA